MNSGTRLLPTLILSAIALSFAGSTPAGEANLQGWPPRQPAPGWGVWRSRVEIPDAGFSGGFSNTELGGFLEFEAVCSQALGTPTAETPYWFRLSNSVQAMGTGMVEFGCWQQSRFIHTLINTAVSTKFPAVTCLRVRVPSGADLRIRAEPGWHGKILGAVKNGHTVRPSSFPADITSADGRNWVAIEAPRKGWVSNDRPDTVGNLTRCQ